MQRKFGTGSGSQIRRLAILIGSGWQRRAEHEVKVLGLAGLMLTFSLLAHKLVVTI